MTERTRFFDGQRLTAGDLDEALSYERNLRWLHNRVLHPWGVAEGLTVSGVREARTITVGAGYALDCRGRDLIVAEPLALQVPPVASDGAGGAALFMVTVSYLEDEALPASTRAGVCGTGGAVRLPERALVRFQSPTDVHVDTRIRPGRDVVLAAVAVKSCALADAPSLAERQDAAVPEPYVAAGQTPAGATAWRLWPDENAPAGVATTVDTTTGAFSTRPRYHAELLGSRLFTPAGGGPDAALLAFPEVAMADATTFELRVLMPESTDPAFNPPGMYDPDFAERVRDELQWCVSWIGVES